MIGLHDISPDGEGSSSPLATDEVGEAISDRLDGLRASLVSEGPQKVQTATEGAVKLEACSTDVISVEHGRSACVFKNNVIEVAFGKSIAVKTNGAVPERLAFMVHGNTLHSREREGSPVSDRESIA